MSAAVRRSPDAELSEKVALVTGAASGIGRAIATRLAEAGARTIFCDIDRTGAAKAAAPWPGAIAIGFDVADAAAWASALDEIAGGPGRLDILVNCAGVYHVGKAEETSFAEWRRVIDINLGSVFLSLKHAAPLMARCGDAVIINIASTLALRSREMMSAYGASKAGVLSLTRSAAREFAEQGMAVRVNAVCPGPTDTPILASLGEEKLAALGGIEAIRERALKTVPLGRFALPQDTAEAVLFLASHRAAFVNGACFVVDGGQSA